LSAKKENELMMKKIFATFLLMLLLLPAVAQESKKPFRAYLFNKEYSVYLRIDFYRENITVRTGTLRPTAWLSLKAAQLILLAHHLR